MKVRESLLSILVILLLVVIFAGPSPADTLYKGITKDDILNILLDREGRIEDLSFSFKVEMITKDKKTQETLNVIRTQNSLSTKGDLFKTTRREFKGPPGKEVVVWEHEVAADGRTVYDYDPPTQFGTIETKLPTLANVRRGWAAYYDSACMRFALPEPGERAWSGNLIGEIQEYPGITILDKPQTFGGRNTLALDMPGRGRLYLDPKLAFAVVGFESEGGDLYRVNSQFKEVMEGFWLPMRSEWRNIRADTIEEITIQVTELKVNQGLTPEDFRIEFPAGTRIYDINLRAYLPPTVGGVSDEYLAKLVDTAIETNMVDVHHTKPTAPTKTGPAGEPDTPNAPARDPTRAQPDPLGTVEFPRRQAIVASSALVIAALILILYCWHHRSRHGACQK